MTLLKSNFIFLFSPDGLNSNLNAVELFDGNFFWNIANKVFQFLRSRKSVLFFQGKTYEKGLE